MEKLLKRITVILQILMLTGAFAVNYFTQTKMGMMRHVMFTNKKWESHFYGTTIKNMSIILLSIILIAAIVLMIYRRRSYMYDLQTKFFIVISMIIIIGTLVFIYAFNTETLLSYYFVSILIYITSVIQVIRLHVFLHKNKKHKFIFR